MEDNRELTFVDIIGTSGKYQILLYLLCFHSTSFTGTSWVTVEILAPMVNMYWDWDVNSTNRTYFSSVDCRMEDILEFNRSSNLSTSHSKLIYESKYSKSTLTEKMNLVCENSWFVSLTNTLCMVGTAIGNILLPLSEKYGRKKMFIVAAVLSVVMSLGISFPQGYAMFAVTTLLFRAVSNQCGALLYIQVVEITSPARAPYIGIVLKSALLVSQALFVCVAWVLKDWFYTQLVQTVLTVGYIPAMWYMLESPIWFAVRGQYDEARKTIEVILQRNGKDPKQSERKISLWLEQMKIRCEVETTAEKGKVSDLFKNKTITWYTLGMTFNVIAFSYITTGLVMNAETFGSGMYVDLTLSNVFSLGSVLIVAILLRKVSLRIILATCFFLAFLSCTAFPITYKIPLARTIITILGRIFVSPLYALFMIYLSEVFPTSVRGVGSGLVLFISCLITAASPFTKEMSEATTLYAPFILYAVLAFCGAVVYMLLPETKGRRMVHTVIELKSK